MASKLRWLRPHTDIHGRNLVIATRSIRALRRLALNAIRGIAFALLLLVGIEGPARAANYTDIWWNASESGWGLTLTHHHDKVFAVWYIYDDTGKPLWLVMPDGAFSNNGRTFSGDVYRTTGPSYREPTFSSSRVTRNRIGTARIDFDPDDVSATVSYSTFEKTITKAVKRQPFGAAPANPPFDFSDLWWNPGESGWGLNLTHHGDNIFGVWYTYDTNQQPLWIVMPGGTFNGNTFTAKLYTTTGSPYDKPFITSNTKLTEVGIATIVFEGATATFTTTVNGHTQTKTISRQPFGTPTTNRPPEVMLAVSGPADPVIAPASFVLEAAASDSDGRIAKVSFFKNYEKIGEASTAPYRMTVTGLGAGTYRFSAQATDDLGATSEIKSTTREVKVGGATPPPATNKPPKVTLTAPAANAVYVQGAAVTLSATASDPDGTVVKVEFIANAAKIGEATASPWTATWAGATQGTYSLTAVATDDKSGTTISAAVVVTVAGPAQLLDSSTRDAARFLTQSTFGMKGVEEVDAIKTQGYEAWMNAQFAMNAASHVQYVNDRKAAGDKVQEERAYEAIWQQWLTEPGQLRARMSFALSEIFVISNIAPDLDTYAMASYMDVLNRNAFGNYRQLLEEVTLHPAMGYYLNMIGSKKEDAARGTHPNENYAREVMQLFSLGLHKLNQDGSPILDGQGLPQPTYDESAVKGLAAAFTGWSFAGNDTSKPSVFDPAKENWLDPLIPWETWHDNAAKTLFNGITIPANQGARKDLKDALDAIFNHPNVGPFIGRELIQRLVTSNPSPPYIGRVAGIFNNNGQGVRGDLRAVIRAVLLDPEARDLAITGNPGWGKQREPVIRFANFLRALKATSPSGRNKIWYLDSADEGLNQSPLLAPSVFNFFAPNYRHPGPLSAAGLVAPEFQITTETSMVGGLNFFAHLARNGYYGSGDTRLTLDLAGLNQLAANPAALADRLNLMFMNGGMSDATRSTLVSTLGAMAAPKTGSGSSITDRVKAALVLVALSPEFVIQK
ncbi:MAG: DUF1800 family protein [Betaproteobacteria bacterium]|nr:DUF1800 family protein [Betaproteobacteria bacterium]